jgi:hypothetical protein
MQARSGACPRRDSTPLGKAPYFHGRQERQGANTLSCLSLASVEKKVLKIVFSFHLPWKKDKDSIRVMTSTGKCCNSGCLHSGCSVITLSAIILIVIIVVFIMLSVLAQVDAQSANYSSKKVILLIHHSLIILIQCACNAVCYNAKCHYTAYYYTGCH